MLGRDGRERTATDQITMEEILTPGSAWVFDPVVKVNPVREAERLAQLVFDHCCRLNEDDRDYLFDEYFVGILRFAEEDVKTLFASQQRMDAWVFFSTVRSRLKELVYLLDNYDILVKAQDDSSRFSKDDGDAMNGRVRGEVEPYQHRFGRWSYCY